MVWYNSPMPVTVEPTTLNLTEFTDRAKFPDRVWIIEYPNYTYGCYYFKRDDIHGLACFSTENGAILFTEHIAATYAKPVEVTFEEAFDLAHRKRQTLTVLRCLFLMDNGFDNPTATYWL